MARTDFIFRPLFGLTLLPALLLSTPNPAAAAVCPPYPQVSWWGNLTHKKTISYVNKNHGGDWTSYITKWERQLDKVQTINGMGKSIRIPSTGLKLEGVQLTDYITKLKQRVDINRCLSMQEAGSETGGSAAVQETKEQTGVADGGESAEVDGDAAPEAAVPEPAPEPALQPKTFEDAVAAFRAGDYETALAVLRPLAKDGMADAQNALGYFYRNGLGVDKDLLQSMFWYQKSARQGNAAGQYSLGEITRKEGRTKVQLAVALDWITKAANQNYADAQYTLGLVFFQGGGIPQDVSKSYFWLALGKMNDHAKSVQLFTQVENLVDEDIKLEQDLKVEDWLSNIPVTQ